MGMKFQAVTFAGGGNRCWWQAGFWDTLSVHLDAMPERVVGVSAGATIACFAFSGRTHEALHEFKAHAAETRSNFSIRQMFRTGRAFPHAEIYEHGLNCIFDRQALARLHHGPELRIVYTEPPWWLGTHAAILLGLGCYEVEKFIRRPVHPRWSQLLGFIRQYDTVDQCHNPAELIELLCASSANPPVTKAPMRGLTVALDGGIVDNVPADLVDRGTSNLVLLTRQYPVSSLPRVPGRVYVQPSKLIPVAKFDHTAPERLQAAFELGRQDAESFVQKVLGSAAVTSQTSGRDTTIFPSVTPPRNNSRGRDLHVL